MISQKRDLKYNMALNRLPEFKGVIVQIVCVVEIQSESARALINITSINTCHAKVHAPEASEVLKKMISIFSCVFLWFKPRTPWEESVLDHCLNKLGRYKISSI